MLGRSHSPCNYIQKCWKSKLYMQPHITFFFSVCVVARICTEKNVLDDWLVACVATHTDLLFTEQHNKSFSTTLSFSCTIFFSWIPVWPHLIMWTLHAVLMQCDEPGFQAEERVTREGGKKGLGGHYYKSVCPRKQVLFLNKSIISILLYLLWCL